MKIIFFSKIWKILCILYLFKYHFESYFHIFNFWLIVIKNIKYYKKLKKYKNIYDLTKLIFSSILIKSTKQKILEK